MIWSRVGRCGGRGGEVMVRSRVRHRRWCASEVMVRGGLRSRSWRGNELMIWRHVGHCGRGAGEVMIRGHVRRRRWCAGELTIRGHVRHRRCACHHRRRVHLGSSVHRRGWRTVRHRAGGCVHGLDLCSVRHDRVCIRHCGWRAVRLRPGRFKLRLLGWQIGRAHV